MHAPLRFALVASLTVSSTALAEDGFARVDAEPPGVSPTSIDEDCGQMLAELPTPPSPSVSLPSASVSPSVSPTVAPALSPSVSPAPSPARPFPHGREIGRLGADACRGVLSDHGIMFVDASGDDASVSAIAQPIRVTSPLDGLVVRPSGGNASSIHSIIDCRLAVALAAWAPTLRAAGVTAIEHVSIFRPGARVAGTSRPSGHSHALAIDALRFVHADGTRFTVLDDWVARARGGDPCGSYDEPDAARAIRQAVCQGAADELFQVIVTPHHDDAHANHVHLEVVPGVDWTALR